MIAIDTNVLLRYLLWDDKMQAAKADKLINGSAPVLITDVVLAETVWALKGKKYKLNKIAIIDVLNSLFEDPNMALFYISATATCRSAFPPNQSFPQTIKQKGMLGKRGNCYLCLFGKRTGDNPVIVMEFIGFQRL